MAAWTARQPVPASTDRATRAWRPVMNRPGSGQAADSHPNWLPAGTAAEIEGLREAVVRGDFSARESFVRRAASGTGGPAPKKVPEAAPRSPERAGVGPGRCRHAERLQRRRDVSFLAFLSVLAERKLLNLVRSDRRRSPHSATYAGAKRTAGTPWLIASASLALIFLALPGANAGTPSYQATGTIRYENRAPGVAPTTQLSQFSVEVLPDHWRIILSNAMDAPFSTITVLYDRTNLYAVSSMVDQIAQARASGKTVAANVAMGQVASDREIYHHHTGPQVGPLWLALASETYFGHQRSAFLEPAITLGAGSGFYGNRYRFKQYAEWKLLDRSPHLPSRIVYFDDDFTVAYDPRQSKDGELADRRRVVNARTNAVYTVHELTTNEVGVFPRRSSLDVYFNGPHFTNGVTYRYLIEVERVVRAESVPAALPALPGVTTFNDYRYDKDVGPIVYNSPRWLSPGDVKQSSEYKQRMALLGRISRGRRWFFVTFCFLIACIPPVLFWWRRGTVNRSDNAN